MRRRLVRGLALPAVVWQGARVKPSAKALRGLSPAPVVCPLKNGGGRTLAERFLGKVSRFPNLWFHLRFDVFWVFQLILLIVDNNLELKFLQVFLQVIQLKYNLNNVHEHKDIYHNNNLHH